MSMNMFFSFVSSGIYLWGFCSRGVNSFLSYLLSVKAKRLNISTAIESSPWRLKVGACPETFLQESAPVEGAQRGGGTDYNLYQSIIMAVWKGTRRRRSRARDETGWCVAVCCSVSFANRWQHWKACSLRGPTRRLGFDTSWLNRFYSMLLRLVWFDSHVFSCTDWEDHHKIIDFHIKKYI